jgi:hypothetical protein
MAPCGCQDMASKVDSTAKVAIFKSFWLKITAQTTLLLYSLTANAPL